MRFLKREPMFHPRVFDTSTPANNSFRQNFKDQQKYTKETVKNRRAQVQRGKMLNAGCGFGFVELKLTKAFSKADVVGIDLLELLIQIARTISRPAQIHISSQSENLSRSFVRHD